MSLSSVSPSHSFEGGASKSSAAASASPKLSSTSFELPDPTAAVLGALLQSPATTTKADTKTTNTPLDASLLLKTPGTNTKTANTAEDDEFAREMRERTKQRKEREDTALAALRVQVRRLEAALAGETKRRVQAVQAAQMAAKEAVAQVSEQWQALYEQEQAVAQNRVKVLEERVEQLEQRWKQDVIAMQTAVHDSAENCNKTLAELQEQCQVDQQSRIQREDQLATQLQTVQDEYTTRWKTERHDRVQSLSGLQQRVETQESVRDAQVQALERRMQEELDHVSAALKVEVQERHEQDAAIVAALNKYTAQVQASLSFVSGV